jgi:hypothetical protein
MIHNHEKQPNDTSGDNSKMQLGQDKLTAARMERFLEMELTALRSASNAHAQQNRMTNAMKEELEELYYDFQCNVARLAIRNRVCYDLFFIHLGHAKRLKGGMTWNNFQKYDPAEQKLFDQFKSCFKY